MFAYSSIEHMGLMTFAFGMGGPIANFAGLLHMTVHSLIKSAIFFAVGHATQKAGTQVMDDIRGLIKVSPTVGWGLMLGSLAILGMPPFGVFASEFLILTTAMREQPWATPFLLLALGVAFASVFSRVQPMVFGETSLKPLAHPPALLPVFVAPGAGPDAGPVRSALPRRLVSPGGAHARRLTRCRSRLTLGRPPAAPLPIWRGASTAMSLAVAARAVAASGRAAGRGLGRGGPRPRSVCAAYALADGLLWWNCRCAADAPPIPTCAVLPCATRMQRAAADLLGIVAAGARDTRPWLTTALWPPAGSRLAQAAVSARHEPADYPFVRVEGDGVHEIPVGPVHAGIIEPGHFRFSVVGEKVLRWRSGSATRTRASSGASPSCLPLEAHRLAGRCRGDSTVAYAWAYCMALESAAGCAVPAARAVAARAPAGARARRQPPRRPRRAGQRCRAGVRPGAVLAPARGLAALSKAVFGHRC